MEQEAKRSKPDIEAKRYLLYKNGTSENNAIQFVEADHHYKAYSPWLGKWVDSKEGEPSLPIVSVTKLLEKYFVSPDFNQMAQRIIDANQDRIHNDPSYKYYQCFKEEDIMNMWSEGSSRGTAMHAAFEDLSNIVEYERDHCIRSHQLRTSFETIPEVRYFDEYCDRMGITSGKRVFYRTEMLMFHDILNISGMADTMLYDTITGGYIITDFKRIKNGLVTDPKKPIKKVEDLAKSARGAHLPAFMKLRNHNTNKYGCQLTLYKALFEYMNPGKRVTGMYLVVVDSEQIGSEDALQISEVPIGKYDECIQQLMGQRALDILREDPDSIPEQLREKLESYLSYIDFQK